MFVFKNFFDSIKKISCNHIYSPTNLKYSSPVECVCTKCNKVADIEMTYSEFRKVTSDKRAELRKISRDRVRDLFNNEKLTGKGVK